MDEKRMNVDGKQLDEKRAARRADRAVLLCMAEEILHNYFAVAPTPCTVRRLCAHLVVYERWLVRRHAWLSKET